MTDDERLPDPMVAADALPRGSMIVVRERDAARRDQLCRAILKLARRKGLAVLVAGDPLLAAALGADGLHLPESRLAEAAHWRARFPTFTITAAVHSLRALMRTRPLSIDAVFLSPVFATGSHVGREPLTPLRANSIARMSDKPVYALGGINAHNAGSLARDAFAGIAAIGALSV
jgi:thiamine-phosphate pyrophosphorylase